jgi:hypothetical protein
MFAHDVSKPQVLAERRNRSERNFCNYHSSSHGSETPHLLNLNNRMTTDLTERAKTGFTFPLAEPLNGP